MSLDLRVTQIETSCLGPRHVEAGVTVVLYETTGMVNGCVWHGPQLTSRKGAEDSFRALVADENNLWVGTAGVAMGRLTGNPRDRINPLWVATSSGEVVRHIPWSELYRHLR